MKKRFKSVIPIVVAATICLFLGGLRARAVPLPLRQTNGDLVTGIGQRVPFVGTNGFAGKGCPNEHQADLMDEWIVIKIEGEGENRKALIMKKNPIAIQTYGKEPVEAKYNDSAIKESVDAWWDHVKGVQLADGKTAQDYVRPVMLQGADQCEPCEYTTSDQNQYRTVVDLERDTKQAFVPSLADVTAGGNLSQVAVDPRVWSEFVGPASGDDASHSWLCSWLRSWLRSPLIFPFVAAVISCAGTLIYDFVYNDNCGVRPACWVRI